MNCYEAIDAMADALEGTLRISLQPAFEEHMAACAPCRTYLEHLRITRVALRRLPRSGAATPHLHELIDRYRKELGRGGR